MKTIKFIVTAIIAVFMGLNTNAQNPSSTTGTKTETFKVSGNCGMCKTTIEKAAKFDGVSKAEWNTSTKVMTVTYNPSKVKIEDVHKKIAAAGYDTEKVKGNDQAYAKLHSCCKYRK